MLALERMLLVIALAVGGWCLGVLFEARLTQGMPIPVPAGRPSDLGEGATPHLMVTVAPKAGAWLARLDAPSLELSTTVLEGTDDGTLRRAAGHIEETPLPGQTGNIGIAGHRDTVFRPLRRARVGDPIDLMTRDRLYHYRIDRTLIVSPEDVGVLDPTGHATLTLVTCYPFEFIGHAPRRFIVQAELTGQEAR